MSESRGLPRLAELHRTAAYRAVVDAWSDPVGLACSGGIDSTALLLTATWALRKGRVGPFVVLHVDHRTRSETAREQRWVEELARALDVPFTGLQIDAIGRTSGSYEAQLRDARYAALASASQRLGLAAIVTAHTLDDQIETILMRLISGSGSLAAAGMKRETSLATEYGPILVLRPLLDIRRPQLVEVLDRAGVEALEDPSNIDTSFRRNAIRQVVVPALRDIDPGFDQGLSRSVDLAALDADYCDAEADIAYNEIVETGAGLIRIARGELGSLHPAIAGRVVRRAILSVLEGDPREITYERVEAVRASATGRSGTVIELAGGLEAVVSRDVITINRKDHYDGE